MTASTFSYWNNQPSLYLKKIDSTAQLLFGNYTFQLIFVIVLQMKLFDINGSCDRAISVKDSFIQNNFIN